MLCGDSHTLSSRGAASSRVSCLMPVHNGGKFLRAAIDSIRAQSFKDFQFIIVNDGSTDESAAIIEHAAASDPRIIAIHTTNKGIVAALNRGLSQCAGQYIARMDADDISFPHRFEYQVRYLDTHLDCVIVGGAVIPIDENGQKGQHSRPPRRSLTTYTSFPMKVATTLHPVAMIRRDALLQIGGYRDLFPYAEDYDLYIRIGRLGTIDNPNEPLIYYRSNTQSVSHENLYIQERSAALSEIYGAFEYQDNMAIDHLRSDVTTINDLFINSTPASLFDLYVNFRVWRRLNRLDAQKANVLLQQIIKACITPDKHIVSKKFWTLRARILGRLILSNVSKLKDRLW
jgi:glycosyltransferase involved in cell wall biosynthesis